MTKYSLGTLAMSGKLRFSVCVACSLLISACAGSIMEPTREVPVDVPCEEADAYNAAQQQAAAEKYAAHNKKYENATNDDSEFVNYTQVAADYKEYGERTPRDQLVVQSGGASNISASIPPSVEDEVIDYEQEIYVAENSDAAAADGENYSSEDPVEDWLAEEGRTLKDLLTEWSEKAGWRLVWKSNRNYTLTAGAMFRGRFADVSSALVRAFSRARPAPLGTFYKGNRVLVVETLEDENAYE